MNRATWALCICVLSEPTFAKTVHIAECLPKPIQVTQAGPIYDPQERIIGANSSIIITHQYRSEIYFSAAYLSPTNINLAIANIRKHLIPENYRDLQFIVKHTSNTQCQWFNGTIKLQKLE
jgi:hypothetical protein